jgi:hypothetical protein
MRRMRTHPKLIGFAMAIGLLSFSVSAHADDMNSMGGMHEGMERGACKADAQKFCADVKPGHGAIKDCLKQHEADLSTGCKDNMTHMKAKMEEKKAEMKKACQADLDQYCKDVTPGEGRDFACLHSHNDKVSAGCKDFMKSMHHERMEHRKMMKENKQGGTTTPK